MAYIIRVMTIGDYDHARQLWETCEHIGLSGADSQAGIASFLQRNQDLSFVVTDEHDEMIGAVLCGHDGRRGYVHHLAVRFDRRRQGIARELIDHCLEELRKQGISKCHLLIFRENEPGIAFWNKSGWHPRTDLQLMSRFLNDDG